jgi:hypothetical protein
MQTQDIFTIDSAEGSIFLDNTIVCSADRILNGKYESVRSNALLTDHQGRAPAGAPTLIAHDLINLSILVESLVCFDRIYVNAAFIDRWNPAIETSLLLGMTDRIVGVTLDKQTRWEAESAARRAVMYKDVTAISSTDALAQLVAGANHDEWSSRYGFSDALQQKINLLTPYNDEATRPFAGTHQIAVGAGFYVACSQLIRIPYRPSAVRAEMLSDWLTRELMSWRSEAGAIAIDYLEKSSSKTAETFLEELASLNLVEVRMPAVLATILRDVATAEEVIPYAMALRDYPESEAFRSWAAEFQESLATGNMKGIVKHIKNLAAVTTRVNKKFGMEVSDHPPSVELGFGPVSVSKSFNIPAFPGTQFVLKSHAWLMQRMYASMLNTARFSDQVERVLFPSLPAWLQDQLRRRPILWDQIRWRQ